MVKVDSKNQGTGDGQVVAASVHEESSQPVTETAQAPLENLRGQIGDKTAASDSFYGSLPTSSELPLEAAETDQMDNYKEPGHQTVPPAEPVPLEELLPEDHDELLGTTLARKYELTQLLGVGAMGRIYRAIQHPINRTVALKILHKDLVTDQKKKMIERRFEREARAASSINHENTIEIYDFGNTADNLLFLVMEFVDGQDLSKLIADEAPLSIERTVHIARQILQALQAAHDSSIAHRDLKPENVMLTDTKYRNDLVKVCDFGIAKVLPNDNTKEETRLTQFGMVCGTPYYMSPEQARAQDLDARTDLYSMGVILFEMLTGHVPFQGNTPVEVIARHLTEPAPRPSQRYPQLQIPRSLEDVVMRSLEKDREKRYGSASEFLEALDAAMSEAARSPQPYSASVDLQEPPLGHDSGRFVVEDGNSFHSYEDGEEILLQEKKQGKGAYIALSGVLFAIAAVLLYVFVIAPRSKKDDDSSNQIQVVKKRTPAVRQIGSLIGSSKRVVEVPVKPLARNTAPTKKPALRKPVRVVPPRVVKKKPALLRKPTRRLRFVRRRRRPRILRRLPSRTRLRKVSRRVAVLVQKRRKRSAGQQHRSSYVALYRSFRSWRRRKQVKVSDLGSLGTTYSKALDMAADKNYRSASATLLSLMTRLRKTNAIPKLVAKRKFDRLQREFRRAKARSRNKLSARTVTRIQSELFTQIFFAYSRGQLRKMNLKMNTAFALLK